jgi:hypothetical protein
MRPDRPLGRVPDQNRLTLDHPHAKRLSQKGMTMKRDMTLAESLRARAFLVRANLEGRDIEVLAAHLEEAAERIEQLELRPVARPDRVMWLH